MTSSLPIVLVPGLLCSARLYAPQIEALWPYGPVTVADHRRDGEIGAAAKRILDNAPPRFALAGLSYGGYLAFAMMRLEPKRIAKLALLNTSARPDTPEQRAARENFIAMTTNGKFADVADTLALRFVHRNRHDDKALMATVRAMAEKTGAEAFILQERAIMSRPDARPLLPQIGCPTLVLVGEGDDLTTPELAREIAGGIAGARLTVVADCGHLSTLERPGPVNEALVRWLAA